MACRPIAWLIICTAAVGLLAIARPALPQEGAPPTPAAPADQSTSTSICLMMESAASANGLPLEFFARLLWQESNFRPNAVGPMTRSGDRAQGIAQFMPRTAAERGLLDPFDPVQALPKAAEYLRQLLADFGNLGLAAAAYNAGPRRVRDWLEGRGSLPAETQRYVEAITGHAATEWSAAATSGKALAATRQGAAKPTCGQMMALLRQRPNMYIEQLQQHVSKSVTSPWGVQVSAGFSREQVLSSYAAIESRHRATLNGLDPIILQTMLRSRGTRPFYQVRIGADTRDRANSLCARLHTQGIACMVLRNKA